jgi:tetratricopeptide (TPR) repeat protein
MSAPAHIARYEMILGNLEDASKWIQHLRDTGHPEDASIVGGQLEFLLGHYEEALAHFAKLRESQEPLYRADSYSLQARVFAELGQYQNAIQALEQGIAADLGAGDIVHRADKLLDRAYINFKRGQYEDCLQDVKFALKLDRSLQRSLASGTILGHAASEATGDMKGRLTSELKTIEVQLPPGEFKPISDIVRAHLRGEVLLAEGSWKTAVNEFTKADQLEAPTKNKEYLARSLLVAATHTEDPAAAARLKGSALAAYSTFALKPGQIWEWPQDYYPGAWSDSLIPYARLAAQLTRFDDTTRRELQKYIIRRAHADEGQTDVRQAKQLLDSNKALQVFQNH